jgi:hypothetical protein
MKLLLTEVGFLQFFIPRMKSCWHFSHSKRNKTRIREFYRS